MIEGTVNRKLEPVVRIEVQDSRGSLQTLEVVLDTAFSGELALPYSVIDRLALPYQGPSADPWRLATGAETEMHTYAATMLWHGQRREVAVLETESESLLGAALLSGSKIYIDFHRGGEVLIEEDWPAGQ